MVNGSCESGLPCLGLAFLELGGGDGAASVPVSPTDDESLPMDHAEEVKQHDDHEDDGHKGDHQQAAPAAIGWRIVLLGMRLHHSSFGSFSRHRVERW
jgi:hypothetical protein